MKVTANVALEVAYHEAIVRQAYKDSVGIWTWSVGVTSSSGHKVERYIDNPQTLDRCLEVYVWLLEQKYAPAVRKAFQGHDLTEEQFAAALSFHWNTGGIAHASWVRKFKAGDMKGAQKAFMQWRKPKEIIPRRQGECDLFFRGKWSNDGRVTEYGVTSRHTPDWRSGKRIDIKPALEALLSPKPEPKPAPQANGGLFALITAILSLFKR